MILPVSFGVCASRDLESFAALGLRNVEITIALVNNEQRGGKSKVSRVNINKHVSLVFEKQGEMI